MATNVTDTTAPESAEAMLAAIMAEQPEVDVEADIAARDRAREAAEQSHMGSNAGLAGLPALLRVDNTVMRGYGAEGPHWVKFVWEDRAVDKEGNLITRTDSEGFEEPVFTAKKIKRRIAPYMIGRQVEATHAISCCHPVVRNLAIAWSMVGGEPGALDAEKCAAILDKMIPKKKMNELTGEMVEREPFTPESVKAIADDVISELSEDNIEALIAAVVLAFEELSPDIDESFLNLRCSNGELTRILGKILAINTAVRDRFLA